MKDLPSHSGLYEVYILPFPALIQSLVVYALAVGMETEERQREALFWAIRLTVVSTAINPVMYGLLCRQYRQLYIYLFRKIFSRCCACLRAPYYNPFSKGLCTHIL